MTQLVLKRASASLSSGEWSDDDYDVLADGVKVGRNEGSRETARRILAVDAGLWAARGPHPDARLRGDTRGSDGGVR
jgi:hypothetical protein